MSARGRSVGRSLLRLLLAVFLAPIVTGVSAQICSFWDATCIDPLAQTAVSVGFEPLFPDPVTFYYGFDATSQSNGVPMTKASYWLRYSSNYLAPSAIDANRTSEVALRVGNLTGQPWGPNNGCDGVWGPECSSNLKAAIQANMFTLFTSGQYYQNPLSTVLDQFLSSSSPVAGCPHSMFQVQAIPANSFAQETVTDQAVTVETPGSSITPWKTWFLSNMTASQQAQQVAVAFISRCPSFGDQPEITESDIQIELVCLKAPSGRGGHPAPAGFGGG
ncbi:hypothetical protein ASPZODRAFT_147049 [Penicilliopsis zonata CBS 506.65]|uniref:Uncharacterized protein n=1 Tax=Penicilliopsis zonata CBS 506.65 TaxID=1073090 RepID=A0A1L9S6T4_9EURO|nr:hypothetical protein ASPZODRAFT_147049 [Penicilliopsis zonata CBS 506.65]OJJ42886.1 hypothetical protein ASPZODRAFT_147049 [Penicilliopsis zonata CBS 506.65]